MPRNDVNVWASSAVTGTSYALMPTTGSFSSFCVNLATAPGTGASWTWALYKNGADQSITVTISGTSKQACDSIHTTGFIPGDLVSLHVTPSAHPASTDATWYIVQTPANSNETILFTSQQLPGAQYLALAGNSASLSAETAMATIIPCAGTVTKFIAEFVGQGTSVKEVLDLNESPTSLSASLATSGVYVEDTGNLSVSAGDVLDINETGITASSAVYAAIVFVPNIPGQFVLPTWRNADVNTPATSFFPITGRSADNIQPAEALAQQIGANIQIQGIYVRATVAPGSGAQYDFTLRDNGASTSLNTILSGTNLTACTTSAPVTGCGTGAVVEVNNFDLLDTSVVPSGSPAASGLDGVAVSYLAFYPVQLEFTTQPPSTGTAGTALGSVVVQVQDASGNVVAGASEPVTIGSTPAGVGGTLTANAVNGVATFNNLVFNAAGTYTLSAAAAGLAGATSSSINVAGTSASITFATSPAGLLVSVDGGTAHAAPVTVTLTSGSHTIAVATTQAGGAGTQYVFTGWSDLGAASHSITVGTSPATYTAAFQTQYQLTTAASPSAGGSVTPATGGFYNAGSSVSVQASSNAGYRFANFSGTLTGTTNPMNVTMNGPTNVVANFTPLTPVLVATVGDRTINGSTVLVKLTLTNNGLGTATNATITGISAISDVAGTGAVTLASGAPLDLGTIVPGASARGTLTLNWPSTATRVSFTVNFTAGGGYTGSTKVTTLY